MHRRNGGRITSARAAIATAIIALLAAAIAIYLVTGQLVGPAPFGRRKADAAVQVDEGIGATVEPLDPATARDLHMAPHSHGLVVTSVSVNGPASRAGVRTGDVIERIGDRSVGSMKDAAAALGDARGLIPLTLYRQHHYAVVNVPVRRAAERHEGTE